MKSGPTRRCILHVGCPKTGTTYLQSVLWDSREKLREQGFRLPLRNLNDHFFLTLTLRGRVDPAIDPPQAVGVLERFKRELRKPGSEHLIVSHELLAAVRQRGVEEFLDLLSDFEVHVVVTARDLARQVPAEWQQHVKTRAGVAYQDFVTGVVQRTARHFWSVQDVASVAERWGRHLPPERVHIVTVPRAGASSDLLLSRFCAAVGLDPLGLKRDQSRTNPSIGYEQAELLRRINVALGDRFPHPRAGYNNVVKFWFAEKVLAKQQVAQRLVLPPERWEWCHEASREIVERIERAGYDVAGDLSDLVPTHIPAAESLDEPSNAEVAAVAVEAIASMLDERHRRMRRPVGRRQPGPSIGRAVKGRFGEPARRAARKLRGELRNTYLEGP